MRKPAIPNGDTEVEIRRWRYGGGAGGRYMIIGRAITPRKFSRTTQLYFCPSSMDRPPKPINLLHPLASLEWRECSEMPLGMSDAQAVLLRNKVYIGGGACDLFAESPASLLFRYDFTDDSWDLLVETPTEGYALITYDSQLVLVGGKDPTTGKISNQLWVMDEQQYWAQPLPPMTTKCSRASAVSVDHHLIVAGGLNDELDRLNVVQVYDGQQWKRVQPLPKAGYFMKSALLDGIWYLTGGGEQEKEIYCASIHSLIVTTSSKRAKQASVWKKLPDVPLEWSTPVVIGKQLAIVGGYTYSSAIHVYSHSTNSWVHVEDLPVACYSTCTLVLPTGELLVVGGKTKLEILSEAFRAKIEVTDFPEGRLTISALDCLEAMAGISICDQLAPLFCTMAAALHLDHSTLNHLRTENNPVAGSKAMFEAWISGKSSLPPTWKMLLEKLHTIHLGELAQRVEHFFNITPLTSPLTSLISESKEEELELDMSTVERKDQQTKPDCRDVAVQKYPDCQEVAVQTCNGEIATVEGTDSIRGMEIIGEGEFRVLTQGGTFQWKGYGLKLHILKGSFPASMEECRINIKVSISGQFQLPEDLDLLSPVFWISAPCKFTRPLTLEIQHCALREDEAALSNLSFVSCKCSQQELPYRLIKVDGGVFTTHSSYGSIQLSHFSGFGVTGRKGIPQSYCAHLYYTMKEMHDWRFYFVITQDLDAKITAVRKHYGHFARQDATLRVRFKRSEITLNVPVDGVVTREGWRITPFSHPTISRKDADQFEPGQWIPECQLIVQWERENQKPVRLRQKVNLVGAKAPYDFIYLTLNPAMEQHEELVKHQSTSSGGSMEDIHVPRPDLKDLMDALYHIVADKWELIGVYLHLSMATLKAIAAERQHDPHKCLIGMLEVWLKRVDPPPTWSAIIEAVEFLGEEKLARELKEKYTLSME